MDPGARLQERYVLGRRIGGGRTTEVWQAWDERLSRAVAVKLVSAQPPPEAAYSRRFQHEARAAAAVFHPHIVIIYDCDEVGGDDGPAVPYIVMEFLEGETLADRIRRGALPVGEAVRVCAQIADALTAAHRTGVAHGDLKPANVFLTSEGVKVLDFGLARAERDPERTPAAGMWAGPAEPPRGTPAYLAPEERLGPSPAMAAAADVYALGVMLTESLTGRRALDASLPEGIPVEVAVLCSRCRARDPAARPSAADVTEILTASSEPQAADPLPGAPHPERPWFSRPDAGRAPETGRTVREGPSRPPVPAVPPPTPAGPPPAPADPPRAPAGHAPAPASRPPGGPSHSGGPSHPAGPPSLPAGPPSLPAGPPSPPAGTTSPPAEPAPRPSGVTAPPAGTACLPADPARRPAGPVWPPADGRSALRVATGMTGEFTIRPERPSGPPGGRQPTRHRWAPRHSGPAPQAHRHLSQEHLAPPGTPRPEPVRPAAEEPGPGRGSHPRLRRFLFDGTLTVAACAVTIFLLSALSAHRRGSGPPADPAVSRPAGNGAAPSVSTGPLAREIAALTKIPPIIQRGLAAGEIRSDVALDLTNVITNLQNDLIAGQRTDPRQGLTELQTKISTRLREGGLTRGRAAELNLALSAVSQRHAALPGAPYPDRR